MTARRTAFRLTALLALGALLGGIGWLGCKADIPDGVYRCQDASQCPAGYSCRREGSADPQRYCFAHASDAVIDGGPNSGGRDAGPGSSSGGKRDGGSTGPGDTPGRDGGPPDGDAGTDGGEPAALVPPTTIEFSSVGERRSGAGLVLFDDGFERAARQCTSDRVLCVTGGFVP